ncbi:MAG: hypothetical protein CO030_02775 [Candidatus Magasanikbacteria bacterium CG_4_9_14_0_2_um_filter_42_11]|uniref:N-end rule aminoacyl transferase C-terminal domain-containing protein n=1 Tax=Candidatus Magasanikbacteria bacterium CG_4_9_14_0_2_um_filter_42_11 TaxID=1974643 RepID=A0A2M8F9P8_9BACT|nr:MAG: hypothetical protein COU34_04820 [Candidatus Magasanikbacteria bacterium CG10_big_fil_rev_8_21_14_0_10_43_9]PIY92607.1 MAG: hypothetical protein COY70_02370 [Candidatus Magasanikbacteria bacterium CG_4_10_14_0_8_um_filter_42_12]PJC52462.1 MAG: hypothetical protein CO030_02775 [Candidatus Magasanikbacteria bacterium CG_4_9_14_0_2_um_filter_42_11]
MDMYLHWDEQRITDFSEKNINTMYNRGFVCVRPENGLMQQTRSIRINLSKFDLSSENKRILRKTEGLELNIQSIPYSQYSWEIGKMGKDFYEQKFGDGTFSANKIKELLTGKRDDFNKLLCYVIPNEVRDLSEDMSEKLPKDSVGSTSPASKDPSTPLRSAQDDNAVGYCIAVETSDIIHYSYPFYNLHSEFKNVGMGMMLRAIEYAKNNGKKYIYLGSFQRPGDIYKLQFSGMEWFDGEVWSDDVAVLKDVLDDEK